MLQRRSYSKPNFSVKQPSKYSKITKKSNKANSKNTEKHKKIPNIIQDLQHNLKLLKKCYEEQHGPLQYQSYCSLRPSRSAHKNYIISTKKNRDRKKHSQCLNNNNKIDSDLTQCLQLEQVQKSFYIAHGYETNNILELYNHYKKNLDKSTGIFGSMSCTNNQPNSINNFSQVHESKIRTGSALGLFDGETHSFHTLKQNMIPNQQSYENTDNFIKKSNELVNVASLLAQRKKNSRDSICEKMNQQNLMVQAKKKLLRPNPHQNIERTYDQNRENQNIYTQTNQQIRKSDTFQIKDSKQNKQKRSKKLSISSTDKIHSSKTKIKPLQNNRQFQFPQISSFKPKQADQQSLLKQSLIQSAQNINKTTKQHAQSSLHKLKDTPAQNNQPKIQKKPKTFEILDKNKNYRLSSPTLPKSIEKYTNSHSKSRSKTKSKQLRRILSPQIQECDLDKGIIFQQELKYSKRRTKQFLQNSLDGCQISVRESAKKQNLEEISFDF